MDLEIERYRGGRVRFFRFFTFFRFYSFIVFWDFVKV